ncbi:hypothetical protein [Actinospica robiniae]|uniref:hypothetical protein n=1 Tax=Actinospica robiniae TaxID=304901 RepID=UPI0004269397|nr:hypothetical protein [Actinospica robiniae]
MTFQEVLTALRARWYAFLAVLLCVAAVGYLAIREKPLYQATAVVALVPPKEPSVPNQLAAATPSLAAVGVAVDDLLTSGADADGLRAQGVTDTFTIAPRNNGTSETPAYRVPSELITVTGPDPDALVREAGVLIQAYGAGLHTMQANTGVVDKVQISDATLAPPTAVQLHGSHSRGAIGVALLGFGLAVAVSLRLHNRRKGRSGSAASWDQETNTEEADAVIV